jgi:hypothetical protein
VWWSLLAGFEAICGGDVVRISLTWGLFCMLVYCICYDFVSFAVKDVARMMMIMMRMRMRMRIIMLIWRTL